MSEMLELNPIVGSENNYAKVAEIQEEIIDTEHSINQSSDQDKRLIKHGSSGVSVHTRQSINYEDNESEGED